MVVGVRSIEGRFVGFSGDSRPVDPQDGDLLYFVDSKETIVAIKGAWYSYEPEGLGGEALRTNRMVEEFVEEMRGLKDVLELLAERLQ